MAHSSFSLLMESGPQPGQRIELAPGENVIGRDPGCQIVLVSGGVSRRHALVRVSGEVVEVEDLGSSNGTWVGGRQISGRRALRPGDLLGLGQSVKLRLESQPAAEAEEPVDQASLQDQEAARTMPLAAISPAADLPATFDELPPPPEQTVLGDARRLPGPPPPVETLRLGAQPQITIGRDPSNNLVLSSPLVSRFHARVEQAGGRWKLVDLRSANGTFVNQQRVAGETALSPGDTIHIGPHRLALGEETLARQDQRGGLQVQVRGLNKWVRKDLNLLQDISLIFQPSELVVVVGQSGGGKSTLVDAIAGYRPATDGQVFYNDIDVYHSFDAVRSMIGYVPQRDIIHMELTAYQALDYAARLRMPPDTTEVERHQRVTQVLQDLDLAHRADLPISGLSGGQQKRVSIGVELLTSPTLFFLDEPTSGLDPGTETALMQLMRRLADSGRTIVLVTHATKNVMLADKVVFLARGGHLAWFGPPGEALTYFGAHRPPHLSQQPMDFDQIYTLLDDPTLGDGQAWANRFRASPACQRYIDQPLRQAAQPASAAGGGEPASRFKLPDLASALRQFAILSSRGLKILTRDRFSLALMLAVAPLVGLLDVLIGRLLGRDLFSYETGGIFNITTSLFLLAVYGVLVGGLAFMREFVKESGIYRRERLVNLQIVPYVLSKMWMAALLALYHAAAYLLMHYLAFQMPGGLAEFGQMYLSLVLATMSGMMLGLFASALAPNANAAPMIVILFMLPQIVLAGALIGVPGYVSAPTSTRWAYEAFLIITGPGSDVAADPCWGMPKNLRGALTIEEKDGLGCRCLGSRVMERSSCTFPGLGGMASPILLPALPDPPPPLAEPPREPRLPAVPEKPSEGADAVALAEFLTQLEDYQKQVEGIQTAYRAQVDAYQAEAETYARQNISYQQAAAQRQIAQSALISRAEALVASGYDAHGWAFVDRNNPEWYWGRLANTWRAQMMLIVLLFAGTTAAIKRKDQI
jgi:ABC transport system ATP-binding/permease protein